MVIPAFNNTKLSRKSQAFKKDTKVGDAWHISSWQKAPSPGYYCPAQVQSGTHKAPSDQPVRDATQQ